MQKNHFFALEEIIDSQPLAVASNTPLIEVVRLMQEWGNSCRVADGSSRSGNSSCVLVVKNSQLRGIFTERDLVKLIATEIDTESVTVDEVMTEDLVTLTPDSSQDVFTVLNILRSHNIRHLPVVDKDNNLLGLITAKNLRQKLQPINMMKWRKVKEIMETEVVYAAPDDSVRYLAKLMTERNSSYVAIAESEIDPQGNSFIHPIGIVTERDIVQFQNLNLDLGQPAQNIMSAPLFLIDPEDTLWSVKQQMERHRVRRLLVGSDEEELLGIVTQTSLLQVFDPSEMYEVIEALQQQVCQLETDRAMLLENRQAELEQEVKERAAALASTNQQLIQAHQQLFFHVNNSPLAVVEWDSNFCVKRWTEQAEQMFGWQESEVMSKCWYDWQFVFAEDIDSVTRITKRLLDGTEPRNISPNRNYTKDGSIIDCEWYNSVLLDESGNMVSILSLVQEVSDRQNAIRDRANIEAELRNRLKQQQAVTELGQFALESKDLALILNRAVNLVANTLEVEYCKVLQLLPDGKNLLLKAGIGWHEGLVGVATVEANTNSQAGYTLLNSEPVVVDNLLTEARFSGSNLLLDHQVVSGMSIAIPDGEQQQPYGILGIHTTQQRNFSQDDVNFIQAVANIIAQTNERQGAESQLKASQERYALAVTGSSSGLWDWNVPTDEVFYAPRFKEIIGYAENEMPNLFEAWSSRLHPEDRDRVLAALQDHLNKRTPYNIEYRLQKKDGEYCWILARGQAIWDEQGQAIRMAGSIDDISDRKRREAILKDIASGMSAGAGENFLPSLVEYLSKTLQVDLVSIGELIDSEAGIIRTLVIYEGGRIGENFEYPLAGAPCENVVRNQLCLYPETIQQLFPQDLYLQQVGAQSYAGIPILKSDGTVFGLIAILHSQPMKEIGLTGEILKIFASRLTTELERQQAELKLRQNEQKFRGIFNQTYQFMGLLKPDGTLLEANQNSLDFAGVTLAEVVGKPFWSTPWWSLSSEIQQQLKKAIALAANGELVRYEVEHPGANGQIVTVDFSLKPLKDETGKVVLLIPESRDISDRKRREEILKDIASGVSIEVGENFFQSLVEYLGKTLQVEYAFISKLIQPEGDRVDTLAVYGKGSILTNFAYDLANAPCGNVIERGLCIYPEAVQQIFPDIPPLEVMAAESYAGMPVFDAAGQVLGLIAVVDSKPMGDVALIEEVLKIFATRATAELERQQAEADLQQSNQILQSISSIQTQFLTDAEPAILFDGMLDRLLELTQSEYGFIGEIHLAEDGNPVMDESYMKFRGRPYLKTHAITNIAWNDETRAFYAENAPKGMEFHNLETLFGAVIVTGEPVIANSPSDDPRRGGLPDGHPPLNAFLGIPFYKNGTMTGMVGIANRAGGYNENIIHYLRPFLDTCSRVIEAYKSERQKQQASAKIREQAALLNLTHDTILVRNQNRIITFWNQGAVEMYGWTEAEALGKDSHQLFGAKFVQPFAEIETELLNEGHWEGEVTHCRKDGSELIVMGRWSLLRDSAGNPQQILEINHDITQRKQAERKIGEQAALLDVATDAIMVRGLDDKILYWNRGAEGIYGWTKAEALDKFAYELLYRESPTELSKTQQAAIEQGEWQGELKQVTKAGKDVVIQSRWTLVRDDAGNPQ